MGESALRGMYHVLEPLAFRRPKKIRFFSCVRTAFQTKQLVITRSAARHATPRSRSGELLGTQHGGGLRPWWSTGTTDRRESDATPYSTTPYRAPPAPSTVTTPYRAPARPFPPARALQFPCNKLQKRRDGRSASGKECGHGLPQGAMHKNHA